MRKLPPTMIKALGTLGANVCAEWGNIYPSPEEESMPGCLNGNTVAALIKRGLLEPAGHLSWDKRVALYRVSEAGKQAREVSHNA